MYGRTPQASIRQTFEIAIGIEVEVFLRRLIRRGSGSSPVTAFARHADCRESTQDYSYLNATIGSTRIARRAGMEQAAAATATRIAATARNVSGSCTSI